MKGIAISGHKPELIIGPFYSKELGVTEELFILHTDEDKSLETLGVVKDQLEKLKINVRPIKIINIFDFYEVYFTIFNIIMNNNIDWINVTAGPGIGLVSISLALQKIKNLKYIYYHESKANIPGYTDIITMENLNIFARDKKNLYLSIIKNLDIKQNTGVGIEDLSKILHKSNSTISRKLNILINMNFIKFTGSGHGNSKKIFSLTDLGVKIYNYSKNWTKVEN